MNAFYPSEVRQPKASSFLWQILRWHPKFTWCSHLCLTLSVGRSCDLFLTNKPMQKVMRCPSHDKVTLYDRNHRLSLSWTHYNTLYTLYILYYTSISIWLEAVSPTLSPLPLLPLSSFSIPFLSFSHWPWKSNLAWIPLQEHKFYQHLEWIWKKSLLQLSFWWNLSPGQHLGYSLMRSWSKELR